MSSMTRWILLVTLALAWAGPVGADRQIEEALEAVVAAFYRGSDFKDLSQRIQGYVFTTSQMAERFEGFIQAAFARSAQVS